MFERFTDRARRVLELAQEEARQMAHPFVGTEHILLGLIHEGDGVGAKVLADLRISLTAAREEVERIVGPIGRAPAASPPFTPRAKKVLELSLREALQLGHHYIGTEHLLLGIVREGEGVAVQVLASLGADTDLVRQRALQLMGGFPMGSERPEKRRSAGAGSLRRFRGGAYGRAAMPEERQADADACSLCGRDVWEADHHVAAAEVRVCDRCIGAAAKVLAAAGSEPRALALPPRVFGEVPEVDADAVDEIVGAVDALVGSLEGRRRREDAVEDVAGVAELESHLRALDDRLTGWSRVSRIRFVGADRAEVRFHFRVDGGVEVTGRGAAMRRGGRWVLTRAAVVDALARAGVRTPHAGD